jgi:hypothetical protein
MPNVVEAIPSELRPEVEAALAFINAERGGDFRVTGIVDPDDALKRRSAEAGFDLSLVLCQGDLCLKEQVRISRDGEEIHCALPTSTASNDDPPAHLDPPVGTRVGWLGEQLEKYAFVVLVFYRGFW